MMHGPLNVKSYQMKGQMWNVIMYILFQTHQLPAKVMPSYSEHLCICIYLKKKKKLQIVPVWCHPEHSVVVCRC